jgi:hypothetical protein
MAIVSSRCLTFEIADPLNRNEDGTVLDWRFLLGMQDTYLTVIDVRSSMLQGIEKALEAIVDISASAIRRIEVNKNL